MRAWMGFRIVDHSTGNARDVLLGDFDEVCQRRITIGGFADCSVHLGGPSAEGVRARFTGGSNHRFLTVESAPPSSPLFAAIGRTRRIDHGPFDIGEFTLQVLEISLETTIRGLSARGEAFARSISNLPPFGPHGKLACPRLLVNLLDGDNDVRSKSRDELRRLGLNVDAWPVTRRQVISQVAQLAAEPDAQLRLHGVSVLVELRAIKALRERLDDPVPQIRMRAARMLWRLTRRHRVFAMPAKRLTVIRRLALRWSRQIRSPVDVLVEALMTVIAQKNPDLSSVFEASMALREIGPEARSAIPVLALAMQKWASGSLPYAADAILESLVAIGGKDAALVLIQSLDDRNLAMRSMVCRALGRLPMEAKIIISVLIDRLEIEREYPVALSAIQALGGFGAAAHAALPAIHRARERFSVYVHLVAAAKLAISQIEATTR